MTGVENGERTLFSYQEFEGLRDRSQSLTGLFAFSSSALAMPVVTDAAVESRRANVVLASGEYFSTLGVDAALGRVFGPDVDRARLASPHAVVSHAFWRDRLQQDPNVIGRAIRIRQAPFTIIGVLPASFTGIVVGEAPEIFVPLTMQQAVLPGEDWLTQTPGTVRRVMFLHVAGRLPTNANLVQATSALDLTFRQNLEAEGETIADAERRKNLLDAHLVLHRIEHGMSSLRTEYSQPLGVLMALVGLLLLLACANVANLLLSRATGRERELAVRVALGAGRRRLIRQLLTESLLLATIGAVVGLAVAVLGSRALLQLVSGTSTPVPLDARLDAPVLAFTAGVTLVTGLLFGLAPALRATRPDLNVVLRGTSHNISGGRRPGRWPLARILVGAQVALSLILLVTAGLFVRSLQNLSAVPLGYDAAPLVMFRLAPSASGYAQASIRPLFEDLLIKMGALPGVRGVSLSAHGLFYGGDSGDEVTFVGYTPPPGLDMGVRLDFIGPRYFETIGVPVRMGHDVQPQDGPHVAWMNESMSRYFFKGESPIGRKVIVHYSFGDDTYRSPASSPTRARTRCAAKSIAVFTCPTSAPPPGRPRRSSKSAPRARRPPSCRRSGVWCKPPTRDSTRPSSAASASCSISGSYATGSRPGSRRSSARWRCCSPRSVSTASCRTASHAASARSACAWRSARAAARSSASSCAKRWR